jgi:hypothetical protein
MFISVASFSVPLSLNNISPTSVHPVSPHLYYVPEIGTLNATLFHQVLFRAVQLSLFLMGLFLAVLFVKEVGVGIVEGPKKYLFSWIHRSIASSSTSLALSFTLIGIMPLCSLVHLQSRPKRRDGRLERILVIYNS